MLGIGDYKPLRQGISTLDHTRLRVRKLNIEARFYDGVTIVGESCQSAIEELHMYLSA